MSTLSPAGARRGLWWEPNSSAASEVNQGNQERLSRGLLEPGSATHQGLPLLPTSSQHPGGRPRAQQGPSGLWPAWERQAPHGPGKAPPNWWRRPGRCCLCRLAHALRVLAWARLFLAFPVIPILTEVAGVHNSGAFYAQNQLSHQAAEVASLTAAPLQVLPR